MTKGVLSMFKMNLVEQLLARFDVIARWIAMIASIVLFVGCSGPYVKTFTMPNKEKVTRVTYRQVVPSFLVPTSKLHLNYEVKGEGVTDTQKAAIETVEKEGRKYVREVRPNNLVSVISNSALRFIAGYTAGYLGSKAFPGADPNQYARYTGIVTGVSGLAYDLTSLGGKTYTFEIFGMQTLDGMFPVYGIKVLIKNPY